MKKGLQERNEQLAVQNKELHSKIDELARARDYSEELLNSMADALVVVDSEGKVIDCNEAYLGMLGLKKEEVVGVPIKEPIIALGLVSPEELGIGLSKLKQSWSGAQSGNYEMPIFTKSGRPRTLSVSSSMVRTPEGQPSMILLVMRDITESKRAEEMLRESEERFSKAFRSSPNLMAISTLTDGRLIDVNNAFCAVTGHTREAIINRTAVDIHLWADPGQRQKLVEKMRLDGCMHNMELNMRTKSGEIRHILFSGESVTLNGEPHLISAVTDVTESKLMEHALQESEEKYRTLFDTMAQGVMCQYATGEVTSANPAAERILGLTAEEMCRRIPFVPSRKILDEDGADFPEATRPTTVSLQTGKPVNNVIMGVFNSVDEQYHWISVSTVPQFKPGEDKPCQVYTTFTDITERKRMEKEVEEKNRQLDLKNADLQLRIDEISKARAYSVNLLSNMVDGFAVVDMKGTLIDVNDAYLKMLGFSKREEVVGLPAIQVMSMVAEPSEVEKAASALQEIIAGKEVSLAEMAFTPRGGSPILVSNSSSVIRDAAGAPMFTFGVLRDITERKAMEDALRVSEEKHHTLFDTMAQGVIYHDATGAITSINPAAEKTLGLTIDQMRLLTPIDPRWKTIHEDGSDFPRETYPAMVSLKTGKPVNDVTMGIFDPAVEQYRWISSSAASQFKPGEDKPYQAYTTFTDITERKRMEHTLQESNQQLNKQNDELRATEEALKAEMLETETARAYSETLLNAIPDALSISDFDGNVIDINEALLKMAGLTREETVGRQFRADLIPDGKDAESTFERLRRLGEGASVENYEMTIQTTEGNLKTISIAQSSVKDASGKPVMALSVMRDITERKVLEDRIKNTARLLEESQKMAHLGNSEWDIPTGNLICSDEFFRIHGFEPGEFTPCFEVFFESIHPDDREIVNSRVTAALCEHKPDNNSYRILLPNGEVRFLQANSNPSFDEAGNPIRMLTILQDITERKLMEQDIQERNEQLGLVNEKLHSEIADNKRAQQEIERANSRLEQAILTANEMAAKAETASHAKSDFLARMSHEIRTPMNAILGMAELLSDTDLTPEQQQYIGTFQSAGENLLGVINDILDITKVESGHMELEKIDFDFRELIESLCEVVAVRAHGKSLELTHYIAPDVPTALIGDPTRLRQIFTNLIGNAIKFTAEGGILVEVKLSDDKSVGTNPEEIELLCSVSDTGIGISPSHLATIFQPFTQADASTTRKYGGTGLGLAIAKQLTELMGGHIRAESEVDLGTKFYFTVRFGVQSNKPLERAQPFLLNLRGVRVLVVDDIATNRLILNKMVSELGARVVEAEDGKQGFNEYQRAQLDADPYRLILLDSRMPGTDGFQMMEKIKGELRDQNTVIMMLTSDNRHGDIARAKEMGIDRYLVKPVKRKDLLAAIADSLGRAKTPEASSSNQKSDADSEFLEALRILLVEDNADNRLLVQSFLKKTPYQIDTAENGEIGVERFKATDYDLVLMDVQMPVMDGYTATGEIRKWEKAQGRNSTPIIALTAHAAREDELKSLQMGCTAHLTKPIKKAHLLDAILGYAHNSRKTEDKGWQASGSNVTPIDPEEKGDQSASPGSESGKPR
ncbi:MAG: PAS domain S-box protein [Dehalococcoidia bacterium]|nr:PAS domain S-box protein [Dehalococcoidia bacterium]